MSMIWKFMVVVSGALASLAVRRLVGAAWPGDPPRHPADRSVDWRQAMGWAALSGLAAGIARLFAHRSSTAAFERLFDQSPPGLDTAAG